MSELLKEAKDTKRPVRTRRSAIFCSIHVFGVFVHYRILSIR